LFGPGFSRAALLAHIKGEANGRPESVLCFHLDSECRALSSDLIGCGSLSDVDLDIDGLVARGKQLNSAGFILVHCSPPDVFRASYEDQRSAMRLRELSSNLKVQLVDFFILYDDQLLSLLSIRRSRGAISQSPAASNG
jgi:DNA repair protein RadC